MFVGWVGEGGTGDTSKAVVALLADTLGWISVTVVVVLGHLWTFAWLHKGLRRACHIYCVASVTIGSYVCTRIFAKALRMDNTRAQVLYDVVDRCAAPLIANRFMTLGSIWVKIGQYMSGRTDMLPPRWHHALGVLQDQMPHDSVDDVDATLREAFGVKSTGEVFATFDYTPMASASIAQVHRATLESTGEDVAVKVMHRGIADIFRADIVKAVQIAKVCAWLNSDFDTMVTVLEAWSRDLDNELDFEREVHNMKMIRRAFLDTHGANVLIPQPKDELCAKHAFAMAMVEDAFKINDNTALSFHEVDKAALLELLVHVWCCMLFFENYTNADPHPGNCLVSITPEHGVRPVLLDWGWCVQMKDSEAEGFRDLVIALADLDMEAGSKALLKAGYQNNQDDRAPERSVEFFGYLFRDTGGMAETKRSRQEFTDDRKAQKARDEAAGVREKGGRKMKKIPDSFIVVTRVVGLLRGLCTTLEVELPLIEIMAMYARLGKIQTEALAAPGATNAAAPAWSSNDPF